MYVYSVWYFERDFVMNVIEVCCKEFYLFIIIGIYLYYCIDFVIYFKFISNEE